MFPKKEQWLKWSLPSKASYIGLLITVVIPIISFATLTIDEFIEDYIFNSLSVKKVKYDYVFKDIKYDGHDREIDEIFYPQISYPYFYNDFLDYLNNEIKDNVLQSINEDLVMYSSDYETGIVSSNLLSLKMTQYTLHYPASNGNHSVWAINVDPKNHIDFDFFDIFDARRNALEKVKSIIKTKNECEFFENFDEASFIPRFYIKDKSIEFLFSEYEVTPGVCGNIIIDVEYSEILDFLQQDGPLGIFISPSRSWDADYHWTKAISSTINKLAESHNKASQ